ncbi:protein shisa-5-like isoform X2 [Ptychodera flava]|uniref:protein shisa-5-like isoform X2 n=1 Tax=Ptychodera flava TaxID=63121 RepID=UPI00396A65CA
MDAILRLCFLLVSILLLPAESQGSCDSNLDCPVLSVNDDDERYCCSSGLFSYCCDFSSYHASNAFDSDDDDLIEDNDEGMTLGFVLAMIFGMIGFIVLIIIIVVVCSCCCPCCADCSHRRTTTRPIHVYHHQAPPVARVTTSNMSSTAAPYNNTDQPPPYSACVAYNAGQGGNVTAMKY